MSKATLEKLIDWGWINKTSDIYTLNTFAADWKKKAGFGEKSVTKLLEAIEKSKNNSLENKIFLWYNKYGIYQYLWYCAVFIDG